MKGLLRTLSKVPEISEGTIEIKPSLETQAIDQKLQLKPMMGVLIL